MFGQNNDLRGYAVKFRTRHVYSAEELRWHAFCALGWSLSRYRFGRDTVRRVQDIWRAPVEDCGFSFKRL